MRIANNVVPNFKSLTLTITEMLMFKKTDRKTDIAQVYSANATEQDLYTE